MKKSGKGKLRWAIARYTVAILFSIGLAVCGVALALENLTTEVSGTINFKAVGVAATIEGKIQDVVDKKKQDDNTTTGQNNTITLQQLTIDCEKDSIQGETQSWTGLELGWTTMGTSIKIYITITNNGSNDFYIVIRDKSEERLSGYVKLNMCTVDEVGDSFNTGNEKSFSEALACGGTDTYNSDRDEAKGATVKILITASLTETAKSVGVNAEPFALDVGLYSEYTDFTEGSTAPFNYTVNKRNDNDENDKDKGDGSVTITGLTNTSATSINIPTEFMVKDGATKLYTVTAIGAEAFKDCTSLTSVTIPNTVTSIGDSAFFGCTGLTSITIPGSVETIGANAFAECSSLTSVTFGNKTGWSRTNGTTTGNMNVKDASTNATNLKQTGYTWTCTPPEGVPIDNVNENIVVTINNGTASVKSVTTTNTKWDGEQYVDYTTNTASGDIVIPAYVKNNSGTYPVTSIEKSAFSSCENLTSVTIPNTVTEIGNLAFNGCTNLTNVTFESGSDCATIGASAFHDTGIYSITIPATVTEIGSSAFGSCRNLTSVTFETNSQCAKIGESAFSSSALYSITIPHLVREIEAYTFSTCDNLYTVNFEANSQCTKIGKQAFLYCNWLTSVTIPYEVTEIDGAFSGSYYNSVEIIFECTGKTWQVKDNATIYFVSGEGQENYYLTDDYTYQSYCYIRQD